MALRPYGLAAVLLALGGSVHREERDFNKYLDEDVIGLSTIGTRLDLERQGATLMPGLEVELWDEDEDSDGPCLLVANAVEEAIEPWGLVARVDNGSYRSESRPTT